ncbi:hypothetical protein GCM10020000_60580 [Streptomyces olivoverticillatus]
MTTRTPEDMLSEADFSGTMEAENDILSARLLEQADEFEGQAEDEAAGDNDSGYDGADDGGYDDGGYDGGDGDEGGYDEPSYRSSYRESGRTSARTRPTRPPRPRIQQNPNRGRFPRPAPKRPPLKPDWDPNRGGWKPGDVVKVVVTAAKMLDLFSNGQFHPNQSQQANPPLGAGHGPRQWYSVGRSVGLPPWWRRVAALR